MTVSAPESPAPDDKDWTWVLEQPCDECGFDPNAVSRQDFANIITTSADRWQPVLARPGVSERPRPQVWSSLEYGCHTRDVFQVFGERARLMLDTDNPMFTNWDQDATAIQARYWLQDPLLVATELAAAARDVAGVFAGVQDDQWPRPGRRSNGSLFTVESLGRYMLHDIAHHLADVNG